MVQVSPASGRVLLTWSDRGVEGPKPAHHAARPGDRGPVCRLMEHADAAYDEVVVLATPNGRGPARGLCDDLARTHPRVITRVLEVPLRDPSDLGALFAALGPVLDRLNLEFPTSGWSREVLLSAGTPQMQTIWVVLVASGLLAARMLQVIPAAFVPDPHPRAVREVHLDIDGFPAITALRAEVHRLRADLHLRDRHMVGQAEPLRRLRDRAARVARVDVPVLIEGETGSGKELLARAIHESGPRRHEAFVTVNCGALGDSLLLSELFGHERGAFTGAVARHRGVFEQAHRGTLFLDEVGELSPRVQTTLLVVLQSGVFRRVGGGEDLRVDVRVIAATHRKLPAMVAAGTFREDLFYRLQGATLVVPPLRDRPEDIPLLIRHFLEEQKSVRHVTSDALELLMRYRWPGNVRELRAEVVRWVVFTDDAVDPAALSAPIRGRAPSAGPSPTDVELPSATTLPEAVEALERRLIARTLEEEDRNLSRAARSLGIDRNTLKRKLRRYGL